MFKIVLNHDFDIFGFELQRRILKSWTKTITTLHYEIGNSEKGDNEILTSTKHVLKSRHLYKEEIDMYKERPFYYKEH